jgi:hypothetical protein
MNATISDQGSGNVQLRELARRTGSGIDVALLWDSAAARVFVAVDDESRAERFRIDVGDRNALDVFNHPYAYRGRYVD